MSEEHGTPDEPQAGQDAWKTQYAQLAAPAVTPAADQKRPVAASSAAPAAAAPSSRSLTLAFLAGALVALLGALVWAVAVIATGYNIGFLAWLVGAATGFTVAWVAGGPVGAFERGLAGLFAAGTIIVGYYVIFIHEVKDELRGLPVGYFDSHWISFFVHHFGRDVGIRPIDWVWILLAAYAAFRVSGARRVQRHSA